MATAPGHDAKAPDVCPFCKEEAGKEHKKTCGLWSPYSNSKWIAKPEPSVQWREVRQYTINSDPHPVGPAWKAWRTADGHFISVNEGWKFRVYEEAVEVEVPEIAWDAIGRN